MSGENEGGMKLVELREQIHVVDKELENLNHPLNLTLANREITIRFLKQRLAYLLIRKLELEAEIQLPIILEAVKKARDNQEEEA